jgi:hypothetical protein
MDDNILYLGDWQFAVLREKATLHGLISNATDFALCWMINIPCEAADVLIGGKTYHLWQPKVYWESMRFPCRSWKQLEGLHCHLSDEDADLPGIYLIDHDDLVESDVHFVSRHGTVFEVDWKFACSDGSGRVATRVTFTEVSVWLDSVRDEQAARRRLQQDLDLSLFGEPEAVSHPNTGPRFSFKPHEPSSLS